VELADFTDASLSREVGFGVNRYPSLASRLDAKSAMARKLT
jgi:hypothetical protein